jgi:hypothetical protein
MDTLLHLIKKAGQVLYLLGFAFLFLVFYGPDRWLPWNWKYTDQQWKRREQTEASIRRERDIDEQYDGYRGRP